MLGMLLWDSYPVRFPRLCDRHEPLPDHQKASFESIVADEDYALALFMRSPSYHQLVVQLDQDSIPIRLA
jgi:hypothetical protein